MIFQPQWKMIRRKNMWKKKIGEKMRDELTKFKKGLSIFCFFFFLLLSLSLSLSLSIGYWAHAISLLLLSSLSQYWILSLSLWVSDIYILSTRSLLLLCLLLSLSIWFWAQEASEMDDNNKFKKDSWEVMKINYLCCDRE